MENAVEAFKIFLGTTIFAIALAVFFRMTSLAKDTADIVFSAIDRTSLINYEVNAVNEDDELGENRIVTFQEIIPTIYRYAQEGYGVTIIGIDSGEKKILGRFDLATESQIASCFWDDSLYAQASEKEQDKSDKIKDEMENYFKENILGPVGLLDMEFDLDTTIKDIYKAREIDGAVKIDTGWLESNKPNNSKISQRICDDIYSPHKLFDRCGGYGQKFVEYIIQIDNNEYIEVTDDEGNKEDTGLLVYGTIRKTKKREIIYVVQ